MSATPRGVILHNPFDLMFNPDITFVGQLVATPGDPLLSFGSDLYGLRAGMKDAHTKVYVDKLDTIGKLITKFAPSSQNDTAAYIADMAAWFGVGPDDPLDLDTPDALVKWAKGIVRQEVGFGPNGTDWFADDLYLQAAKMALG